ncbi:MAG: hypothetical protein J2P37_30595, partial [Ktedonobacteraceae bacterium]|nr:hypothetical protein [Ktedonobacteraceae bacterium]
SLLFKDLSECCLTTADCENGVNMPRKPIKNERISYRLSDREFGNISNLASEEGVSVHEWCRSAALEKLKCQTWIFGSAGEWETYRLLAQIRFLLGHGLRLLANGALNAREWERIRNEATESATAIATELLSRD